MRNIDWNRDWKFWRDKDSFALVWDIPENARNIDLPHDAMMEDPASPESRNGNNTGYRDAECYTYVKVFEADKAWKDTRVTVRFDGVYNNALVYLNGQLTAKNPFGYTAFYAELTDYLRFDGPNELRVLVRPGAMTNSRWYSGAGIYRDVFLNILPKTHIEPMGVCADTVRIEDGYAVIQVKTEFNNMDISPVNARTKVVIYDRDGNGVAQRSEPVFISGGGSRELKMQLVIPDALLWDEDDPNLYRAVVSLHSDGTVIDEDDISFGVRTVSADAKGGLRINGRETLLKGACIHHDSGILGAVTYYEAEYRRVKRLKEAGFNAVRMAHHPASGALLKACDELGMYVMDELSDMWDRPKSNYDFALDFDEWWPVILSQMVRNDRTHPCVIMYSIGNEIPEIGTPKGADRASELARSIKETDDTRLVTAGINGVFAAGDDIPKIVADVAKGLSSDGDNGGNVNDFMTLMDGHLDEIVTHRAISKRLEWASSSLDVAGYNYMTARFEPDGEEYPDRVIVASETYPPEIARNWELTKRLSHVIGDFTWTGWDYLGEAGVGIPAYSHGEGGFGAVYPAQLAFCGDIDITGFRRPLSYFREIVFGSRNEPFIAVQNPEHYGKTLIKTPWVMSDAYGSWSYPGYEGKPVVVEVYAPGDETELLINGNSLGRKPSGRAAYFRAIFETVYEPGELVAVCYEKGREISRHLLTTCGDVCAIAITKEKEAGSELAFFEIELKDDKGGTVTHKDMVLSVEAAEDAGIWFGSGDPKPVYNYTDRKTKTFFGRAQIIAKVRDGVIPSFNIYGEGGLKAEYSDDQL